MILLEVIVVVGLAVLAGTVLGPRWRVTPALVLLGSGIVLGLLPALRHLEVPPEFVLLAVLPALLYWESLTTSLREIRANLRVVVLLAVVLVVVTSVVVAVVLHAFGMAWGPAWVLGAILAPTDATAVGRLAHGMPRRLVTTLRAESLINDGTALVIYAIAIHAVSEPVSNEYVVGRFVLSYTGGVLVGVVVWRVAVFGRERLTEPIQQSVISVLTPFSAFLIADLMDASGVLAVVVAGLMISQSGPRLIPAAARVQAQSFWAVTTYLLSGGLFVLMGIELFGIVEDLPSASVARGVGWSVVAFVAVIGVRVVWFHTTPYVLRAVDRRAVQRTRRVSWRHRMPSAWAGFRGAISLALAFGVPARTSDGAPFPDRELIIFVTGGVILATLVLQGLTLPAVIRWARLPADETIEHERYRAEKVSTAAALAALPAEAERLGTDPRLVAKLRAEYQARADALEQADPAEGAPSFGELEFDELRLAVLAYKRAAVIELRDAHEIDDIVLREVQAQLDAEEVRLSRGMQSTFD